MGRAPEQSLQQDGNEVDDFLRRLKCTAGETMHPGQSGRRSRVVLVAAAYSRAIAVFEVIVVIGE